MNTSIETIRTDIITGDRTIGVAHAIYEITASDGSRRVAGQITARRRRGTGTEFTAFAEHGRDTAIQWYLLGDEPLRPGTTAEPTVLSSVGGMVITWEDPQLEERLQLADDLARWAGEEAERAHDEDVAAIPDGRHYTYCCMSAREDGARNEFAFAMELPLDRLRTRHAKELEERAVARAQREGVL